MFVILWEYQVRPERQAEFEHVYAPEGAWAELFKKGEGFLGTELLCSDREAATYLTMDKWVTKEAYENFLQTRRAEYRLLDEKCASLTRREKHIGNFRAIRS